MKKPQNRLAKILAKELAARAVTLNHSACLDIAAKLVGEKSYHTLTAKSETPQEAPTPPKMEFDKFVQEVLKHNPVYIQIGEKPPTMAVPRTVRKTELKVTIFQDWADDCNPGVRGLRDLLLEENVTAHCERTSTEILPHHKIGDELEKTFQDPSMRDTFDSEVPCTKFGEVFLTNVCGENTGHVNETDFESMKLPLDPDFFPLTEAEAKKLSDIVRFFDREWYGNYTLIWDSKKWWAPTLEIPYDDPFWGSEKGGYPPEATVLKDAQAIHKEALAYAEARGGTAVIEDDMPGRINVRMRLPLT